MAERGDVVRTTVYLDRRLYERARELNINFSDVLRRALIVEISIREELMQKFREEYALLSLKEKANIGADSELFWDDESGAP